jgi:hypothetical protein
VEVRDMADNVAMNLGNRVGCHCWGTTPASVAALPAMAEVGCRWVRATRPMQMEVVSTGPRQYDFALGGEASVDLAIAHGMSIMGILDGRWGNETLLNTLPYASPIWEHLDLWEDFTTATVRRYRDRVKYWEIINEPPFFWWYPTPEGVQMPEVNPVMQRAPIWAYVELLRASARAIRAADPDAKIVLGSGFGDGMFLKRIYELGGRDAFDVVSVHYLSCKHPQDFARPYRLLREVMAANGDAHKPLWDTENGPFGAVIGQAVSTPEEYEGLFNIYRHCFAYEFGLDRYFWFNTVNARGDDGALSAPYQAMATLARFVGEGTLIGSTHLENEAHAYAFDGPQGPVTVLWATAPADVSLGGPVEAWSYLGEPTAMPSRLTGAPLFIAGDVRDRLDVTVRGPRETVVAPRRPVPADVPHAVVPQASPATDADWAVIPVFATRDEVPVVTADDHFVAVPTSVTADVQLAWDAEALHLRVRTYDDTPSPYGLVQLALRDSDPGVTEWSFFYNAYGLFNLYASPHGPRCLRFEHLDPLAYPAGVMATATLAVEALPDGLRYTARLPWAELGPCRPERHEPFLLAFTFNRADNMLAVPAGDAADEWSHNFNDTFIVKAPALQRWVRFTR